MYNGSVVDAHHHLWDLSLRKHPWLLFPDENGPLAAVKTLAPAYLPMHYADETEPHHVVGSVHIEALWDASDPVGETRWLETLDKPNGIASRYVAAAPLGTTEGKDILRMQAAFDRVVGIRAILSHHPDPHKSFVSDPNIAYDGAWRDDVALLHKLGLHLELMMYPYQAQVVTDLANAFPDLQIIVNHCGSPIDRDDEGMQRWRASLEQIASCRNVALKISNPGAYDPDWTPESIQEVVLDCIRAFGFDRCMFGTDYPVSLLNMTVDQIYTNFKQAVAHLPLPEQRALFQDNAVRFYRL